MSRTIGRICFAGCLAMLGCDRAAPVEPPAAELNAVDTARAEFPTFLSFQTKAIARSCSPNPGVCHQTNNHPDLRTPSSMLAVIGMPCNLEIPDPTRGWDSCEGAPDRLEAEAFTSDIAWKKRTGAGRWRLGLRDAAPLTATVTPVLLSFDGDELLEYEEELGVRVVLTAGADEAELFAMELEPAEEEEEAESFAEDLDALMSIVVGGDPNRNGVWGFGAEEGALIVPKSLERSYLWGRVTGTVPGSRMPLANQPLSDPEYIALACWIEGLDPERASVDDPIDYDRCAFAKSPVSYAITAGSGAE